MKYLFLIFVSVLFIVPSALAQSANAPSTSRQQASATRTISGVIVSQRNELVPNVKVIARSASGGGQTVSEGDGNFRLTAPDEDVTLSFEGDNISKLERVINRGEQSENLQIKIEYVVPPVHESVVIVSSTVDPSIERRNDTVTAKACSCATIKCSTRSTPASTPGSTRAAGSLSKFVASASTWITAV